MSHGRKMLLETLAGHLALLETAYPRKANTQVARRTNRYVKAWLKRQDGSQRRAAA